MFRTRYFFILMLFLPICLCAGSCKLLKGHRLLIGPEVYSVDRYRQGGTHQRGCLYGGRLLFDHLRRYTFYWAIEGAIASGELSGKSSSKAKLKSNMRDRSIEARLGYTFQYKYGCKFSFTPFVGVGSQIEDNDYKKPSPLHLHFKIAYRYVNGGFISSFYPHECFKVGLNVKIRYLLDPECTISHDPEFRSTTLKIGNDELQYRIELPLTYDYSKISFVATPFYESRVYGGWMGYPFDFLKTRINNYGVTLQIQYAWN